MNTVAFIHTGCSQDVHRSNSLLFLSMINETKCVNFALVKEKKNYPDELQFC